VVSYDNVFIDDKFNLKIDNFKQQNDIDIFENEIENTVGEIEQNKLIENLQESKIMSDLKQMFNDNLMIDIFNESGINAIEDLNNKSEDELGELLKKICK